MSVFIIDHENLSSPSFPRWLEPWTACLAAIAIFYVVTDVFGIWSNKRLRRHIREFRMITED